MTIPGLELTDASTKTIARGWAARLRSAKVPTGDTAASWVEEREIRPRLIHVFSHEKGRTRRRGVLRLIHKQNIFTRENDARDETSSSVAATIACGAAGDHPRASRRSRRPRRRRRRPPQRRASGAPAVCRPNARTPSMPTDTGRARCPTARGPRRRRRPRTPRRPSPPRRGTRRLRYPAARWGVACLRRRPRCWRAGCDAVGAACRRLRRSHP
mmetsp:Transcript_41540/g.128358  ORF Transcript_41540/g.128358 Transcript_41540/m.128358 type:complete len:214 (-) Transcript_41540:337-978(-)